MLSFTVDDILLDEQFLRGLDFSSKENNAALTELLEKFVKDNVLVKVMNQKEEKTGYFINSPRGRAAADLVQSGSLFEMQSQTRATLDVIKPNIFKLYEENIGPLTPLIADALRDAEESYPEEWIGEAIRIAVANNVRRWNYIDRILTRWQEEGRDGTDRRNNQEDYRRYLKGEYGEFGSH